MANTSKNEKIIFTLNGRKRSKSFQINNYKSEQFDEKNMSYQFERLRDRRNASGDTSAISASCEKHCYHQLAERVRELEKEIVPDSRLYQIPAVYSPFSALTPCSNVSGNAFSNYSRPQNFPVNLLSPNSSVPTQKYGLSPKIFERAHQIPERFWIDWQQKQMQNRIEELEYIKNNLTSPNNTDLSTSNRRKSLLLLHNKQPYMTIRPRSTTLGRIISTSIDNETSSSTTDDSNSFSFDQRSINGNDTANIHILSPIEPINPNRKTHSTLDRSRLTIFLPHSYTNIPNQPISTNNHFQQSIIEDTKSYTSSIEDVAQIDTEVNLTLLHRETPDQINPLLYSKAIMNRTIEFRSSSNKYKTEIVYNNREIDNKSSTDSFASTKSSFSIPAID